MGQEGSKKADRDRDLCQPAWERATLTTEHSSNTVDGYERGRGSWPRSLTSSQPNLTVSMLMRSMGCLLLHCSSSSSSLHAGRSVLGGSYSIELSQESLPRVQIHNIIFIYYHDARRANSRARLTINSRPRSVPSKLLSRPSSPARQPWRVSGQIRMHGRSALPR